MDTGRQLLRFSIPGSVLLLWGSTGIVILRLIAGVSLAATTSPFRDDVAAFAAILAAIPLGFIVYQAYYVFYRPMIIDWSLMWNRRWVRLDRGSQVLSQFEDTQIQALRDLFGAELDVSKAHEHENLWPLKYLRLLKLSHSYIQHHGDRKSARAAYRLRWYDNWDVLRAIVDISEASDATRGVKREYVNLSDLYHALGATRTAVWAGWTIALAATGAATAHLHESFSNWLIGVGVFSTQTAILLTVIHQTRRQTWLSASKSLLYGLRWIFENHPELLEPAPEEKEGRLRRFSRRVSDAVRPDSVEV